MEPMVVILSCERPGGTSFVQDLARAVDREGGARLQRLVFVDGDEAVRQRIERKLSEHGVVDWQVVALGPRRGSTLGMQCALSEASRQRRDVLFFEDDVLPCKGAVERMLVVPVPEDCGCITFFDMKDVPRGAPPGLYRYAPRELPGWDFWGCQSLRLPVEMVHWLASQSWASVTARPVKMGSDLALGILVARHPGRNKIAVHIPSLVQHIGFVSACFPGIPLTERRSTRHFRGVGFDATSLPPSAIIDFCPKVC